MTTFRLRLALVLLLGAVCARAEHPRLLVYLPFDGGASPVVGRGAPAEGIGFAPGRHGQAAQVTADLSLPAEGNWPGAKGTFAAWVNLAAGAAAPRYLLCVYGHPDVAENYRHNRFSLYFGDGTLHGLFFDAQGRQFAAEAPAAFEPDTWHHVAATWWGLDDGDGMLRLYVDGRRAAETAIPAAELGRQAERFHLGRDADASPDYLHGLLDEVYLYDAPLTDEAIAAAAAAPAGESSAATPTRAPAPDTWWNSRWPLRARVALPTDAGGAVAAELSADLGGAARDLLGRYATLDPDSIRVLPVGGEPVPHRFEDGRLTWPVDGAGREFEVYFGVASYETVAPLQTVRRSGGYDAPPTAGPLPDYATQAYGDAWDFDEGDLEAIDQWGNKPEFIRGRSVEEGALHLEVEGDPWFIWGNMWGQVDQAQRPVDIDLDRYRILELRLRQSVPSAEWTLYARPGTSTSLLTHDFRVDGTGWQTVRVNLHDKARWRGHISAFRIDPTNGVEATVDIDYVRLLAVVPATLERVETLGSPTAPAAAVALAAPGRAIAGEAQEVTVRVTDAAGEPVVGQPVTVRLSGGRGARLAAAERHPTFADGPDQRRGVTGPDGELPVVYHASQQLSPEGDRITAVADFSAADAAAAAVATEPGPAARWVVSPQRAMPLAAGERSAEVTAQIADSYGNPLALAGRSVTLSAPAGARLEPASGATDAAGRLTARLTLDPDARWTAKVSARDDQGLEGLSGAVCYTPAERDWGVRLADNGYFVTDQGRGWLPLGGFYANWVGDVPPEGEAGRRLTSFVDTSDEEKVAWLRFLADQGVTALRFMLRAHRPGGMEPMDIGGKVNPELYAEVLHYMDLARPFGIRFLLVLHEDYTKPLYYNADYLRRFVLPRWEGVALDALPVFQQRFLRDQRLLESIDQKYTDPDAIAAQDQYAREVVALFKDNPQVFAYELENEMVAPPVAWINHACDVIRSVDSRTPICMSHGGGGLHTGDPYFWTHRSNIDFYTYHLYPHGTTTEQRDYGLAVDVLARYGRMAGDSFLGESVGDQFSAGGDEPLRRRVARDIIWFSLVNGNPGCMFWNARGHEVNEFALARRITDGIDFAQWQPRRAPIGIVVSHPLDDDRYYRSEQGQADLATMSAYSRHYLQQGADFDFAWSPDGYAASAGVDAFDPPPATRRPVAPSDGFEAASWAREGDAEGLAYVRNVAAVVYWVSPEKAARGQWLREVAPRALTLQLGLAPGRYTVDVVDLVDQTTRTVELAGDGHLDLGTTDHDFALRWTKK